MPDFEPFHGERYAPDVPLDRVVAPPYDVISPNERTALLARHPANAVAVELPLPPGSDPDPDAYTRAAQTLADWRRQGLLVRDERRALYGYRMTTAAGRQTTGVIGALRCTPNTTDVVPHEETTPRDMTDRLALLEACRTNVSPIWALSLAPGLGEQYRPVRPADADATVDGVRHELWVLDDPDQVAAVCTAVAGAGIVLADGHHRFATAQAYAARQPRLAMTPGSGPSWIMAYVVELDPRELEVGPIHRLVSLPGGFEALVERVSHYFDLEECAGGGGWGQHAHGSLPTAGTEDVVGEGRPATHSWQPAAANAPDACLQLLTGSGRWRLHPTPATAAAACPRAPLTAPDAVDSSLVTVMLAASNDMSVRFEHDEGRVLDAVRDATVDGALLLRAVPVETIRRWAAAGRRMPPKSTYFWPKPRAGMVWRDLDG